jgi:hypothetical protein
MAAIADLERFLERLFERTSARVFHAQVQAVQVERRLERAMEDGRQGRGTSTQVPSGYRVRLEPADLDDLAARSGGPEALARRLADEALAFARLHAYHMAARPTVSVVADPSVERGRFEVDAVTGSGLAATVIPSDPFGPPAPLGTETSALLGPLVVRAVSQAAPLASELEGRPLPTSSGAPSALWPVAAAPVAAASLPDLQQAAPVARPVDAAGVEAAAPPEATGPEPAVEAHELSPTATSEPELAHGIRANGTRPYAVRPAAPPPARAMLLVTESGGREREVRIEGQPLTLGRAPDNGLVITDARVSRHHGRFQTRNGTLVYTDLASTNGTRVNGIRVDEIVLGAGDRLQVGSAVVVVEQLPG